MTSWKPPAGTDEVVIASDTMRLSDARSWLDDRRRLGVQARRVRLLAADEAQEIALDGPPLAGGWHAVERTGRGLARWPAGAARLPLMASLQPWLIERALTAA